MYDLDILIKRWMEGDARAAEAIYDTYLASTLRLAYGLLGDVQDAEEVAQDTLAYALAHIERYDAERARFTTWLHTIAVCRCRNRRRRKQLRMLPLVGWLAGGREIADPTPWPEQQAAWAEAKGEVWRAVQSLPPVWREAILLRYWGGHTYLEIATITGCPMGTVQSRVRLAFARLRDVLDVSSPSCIPEQERPAVLQVTE